MSLDLSYYDSFHKYAILGGKRWHYLDVPPTSTDTNLVGSGRTLVLCHGFPDSWYGWRRQIPALRELGYRQLVISQMGYTRSEAPLYPTPEPNEKGEYPELGIENSADELKDLECYTGTFYAHCLNELLTLLNIPKVTIIGHDYGAFLGPKLYLYYPEKVDAIATSCWHYTPALVDFYSIPELIERAPTLAYQAYLNGKASGDLNNRQGAEAFLRRVFSYKDEEGKPTGKYPMSEEEFQNYMKEFATGGRFLSYMVSTYKARRLTYDFEKRDFIDKGRSFESMQADVPYLHVGAKQDMAFQPFMMMFLREFVAPGRMEEVWIDGTHWLLFEKAEDFNHELIKWLKKTHGINPKV